MTLQAPTILAVSPDNIAFDIASTPDYSNQLTLVGDATAGSVVTIYDGSTLLGTTAANSSGVWSFTTPSALADGAHSFTATATVSGVTSAPSSAASATVAGAIANFSPLTDQWSTPISVGGNPYFVENANTNGNAPWAIAEVDDHTFRFEVRPADLWPDNGSHRSEISGSTLFAATSTVNLSYQFQVEPGFNDTSNNIAWQILGQFHADDNNPIYQSISGGNPMLAFHLTGANGFGEGDYLAIGAFYALTGQTTFTAATPAGNPLNGYLYVSPTPIVRGQNYSMQVEVSFQNNANGFLEVWINGTEVVNYHGPIGYGGGNYWKEGVYEGWSSNQTIAVVYKNTMITATPGAPIIFGDAVNGNQVMLNGTADANSTVAVYDGATKLGTTTASANGSWFYETGALSVGTHSLTAKVTDSAGNVSAASSVASATIASFTGPIVTQVTSSAASGTEKVTGNTITLTLTMSSVVTVTGTPALTLSDGGTATYASGSGTNTLTFSYTVGASDTSGIGLSITDANLPGGATIKDGSGNAANLAGAAAQFSGVIVDSSPVQTPVFGGPVANNNGTFTFTGTAGANTTVNFTTAFSGGLGTAPVNGTGHWTFTTPTMVNATWNGLQAYDTNSLGDISTIGLESGGGFGVSTVLPPSPMIIGNALNSNIATLYGSVTSGFSITTITVFDGTTRLGTTTVNSDGTWSFTTGLMSQGVHSFAAEATNTSGTSAASAKISMTVNTGGLPAAVTIAAISDSPSTGDLDAGHGVTLTVTFSAAVTVTGVPTLTLNDGGVASYVSGSGSTALVFSTTVGSGQNAASLAVTSVNLPSGATIVDGSSNAAGLSVAGLTQTGPMIDTTAPVTPVIANATVVGTTITLTGTSEANATVTVYNGAALLGTALANGSGAWAYSTSAVPVGSMQALVTTATDAAGNTGSLPTSQVPTLTALNASNETIAVASGGLLYITGASDVANASSGVMFLNAGTTNASLVGNFETIHVGDGDTFHIAGTGDTITDSNGTMFVNDPVANLSIIGSGETIHVGDGDTLNVTGSNNTVIASNGTIYLNANSFNTTFQGSGETIHIRAGDTYTLTNPNNTIITDTVINTSNGATIQHYNGSNQLLDLTAVAFDSSMTATEANISGSSADIVLASHGSTVATIHLQLIQSIGSFTVRSDGASGTLIVDPPAAQNSPALVAGQG
jgi:large repetitive protein